MGQGSPVPPETTAVPIFLSGEEGIGEAVIDTGASRSVIGEMGVEGLVRYMEDQNWGPLKKCPPMCSFVLETAAPFAADMQFAYQDSKRGGSESRSCLAKHLFYCRMLF